MCYGGADAQAEEEEQQESFDEKLKALYKQFREGYEMTEVELKENEEQILLEFVEYIQTNINKIAGEVNEK